MLFHPSKVEKALILAFCMTTVLQTQSADSQVSAPTSRADKLAFDAASVRASTQELPLKGADFLNPAGNAAPPQGGLFSWNVQLPWLINFAFDLRSSQTRRQAREALPKWSQRKLVYCRCPCRRQAEPRRYTPNGAFDARRSFSARCSYGETRGAGIRTPGGEAWIGT